jgi:hypothetical protein
MSQDTIDKVLSSKSKVLCPVEQEIMKKVLSKRDLRLINLDCLFLIDFYIYIYF